VSAGKTSCDTRSFGSLVIGVEYDADLAIALDMARRAADVALGCFDDAVSHKLKPDGSPVTEVDLAIEADLIATLARERPDDAILSEERGEIGSGNRRWMLDPLDGTSMFLDHTGGWGTLVTLQEDGKSLLAVITRPLESRLWWAVRGQGAYGDDLSGEITRNSPVRLSQADTLDAAQVMAWGDPASPEMAVLAKLAGWNEPGIDSFIRLVDGELDVIVSFGGLVWDHAPCVLLVEEAGGAFRDRRGGKRLDLLGGVYSNAHLSDAVGELLGWY